MKTRNGFVSNSSSSSFVVVFPEEPKSPEDVKKHIFNGVDGEMSLDYYDYSLSHDEISNQVFAKCKHKATKEELTDEFMSILYDYFYDVEKDMKNNTDKSDNFQIFIDCVHNEGLHEAQVNIVLENIEQKIKQSEAR